MHGLKSQVNLLTCNEAQILEGSFSLCISRVADAAEVLFCPLAPSLSLCALQYQLKFLGHENFRGFKTSIKYTLGGGTTVGSEADSRIHLHLSVALPRLLNSV